MRDSSCASTTGIGGRGASAAPFLAAPKRSSAEGTCDQGLLEFRISRRRDIARPAIESFVGARYKSFFGVSVRVDYPIVLSLVDEEERVHAAVGIRQASEEPLFLEQYLPDDIQLALHRKYALRASRARIVELGSFAATCVSTSLLLIGATALYMAERDYAFAVVTATPRIRRLFSIFGFDVATLTSARKEALEDRFADWGTYYDDDPQVIAADVQACRDAVMRCGAIFASPSQRVAFGHIVRSLCAVI